MSINELAFLICWIFFLYICCFHNSNNNNDKNKESKIIYINNTKDIENQTPTTTTKLV